MNYKKYLKTINACLFIFMILLSLFFFTGCKKKPTSSSDLSNLNNVSNQSTHFIENLEISESEQYLDFSKIYKYDSVKTFQYKITSSNSSPIFITYTISPGEYEGVGVWIQDIRVETREAMTNYKMYVDKVGFTCIIYYLLINRDGQTLNQVVACPREGPNAFKETKTLKLEFVEFEKITVPLGTFSAKKYKIDNVFYWIVDSVPVPLKVTYGDSVMELLSYSS